MTGFQARSDADLGVDVVKQAGPAPRAMVSALFDPAALLPTPPTSTLSFSVDWPWASIPDLATFTRLLRNHGQWSERHSAPDSPFARYCSEFLVTRRMAQNINLIGKMSGAGAEQRVTEQVAELSAGVCEPPTPVFRRQPWLADAARLTR